jgi:hypothetical protein
MNLDHPVVPGIKKMIASNKNKQNQGDNVRAAEEPRNTSGNAGTTDLQNR